MKRRILKFFIILLIILAVPIGLFHYIKPLPEGISIEGELVQVTEDQVEFLSDSTYINNDKKRQSNQEIFDRVFSMIKNAQEFILIDMFLFGSGNEPYRDIAKELVDSLIEKKQEIPDIDITFITSAYNTMYADFSTHPLLHKLQNENIRVVPSNIMKLRDSNPFYSAFWRITAGLFPVPNNGFITNPLSDYPKKIGIRNFLTLLNFKANHRKVVIADNGDRVASLVTSGNPHGPSSAHSNVALYFESENWRDLYASEQVVFALSGIDDTLPKKQEQKNTSDAKLTLQVLTEKKIKNSILSAIQETKKDDQIKLAMFYLSDRDIIKSLIAAGNRKVKIKIILDPNKDAFGIEKNGIPNRQSGYEILQNTDDSVELRWYDTHGEQYHTKLLLIDKKDQDSIMILGSANYTKRNLDDFNLETNIFLKGTSTTMPFIKANNFFDTAWSNPDGKVYTTEFETYKDDSKLKAWIYRFQEALGMSTF